MKGVAMDSIKLVALIALVIAAITAGPHAVIWSTQHPIRHRDTTHVESVAGGAMLDVHREIKGQWRRRWLS